MGLLLKAKKYEARNIDKKLNSFGLSTNVDKQNPRNHKPNLYLMVFNNWLEYIFIACGQVSDTFSYFVL